MTSLCFVPRFFWQSISTKVDYRCELWGLFDDQLGQERSAIQSSQQKNATSRVKSFSSRTEPINERCQHARTYYYLYQEPNVCATTMSIPLWMRQKSNNSRMHSMQKSRRSQSSVVISHRNGSRETSSKSSDNIQRLSEQGRILQRAVGEHAPTQFLVHSYKAQFFKLRPPLNFQPVVISRCNSY